MKMYHDAVRVPHSHRARATIMQFFLEQLFVQISILALKPYVFAIYAAKKERNLFQVETK